MSHSHEISRSPAVTAANLLHNNLDRESATMLTRIAAEKKISLCGISPHQTFADFSNEGLGPIDSILIASDLGVRPSLTSLSLRHNFNMKGSGEKIGEALRTSSSLTELDMGFCGLGPDDGKGLAGGIAASGSLMELSIDGNNIGEEGAQAIADALKMNESCALKELVVPDGIENHEGLKAACQLRGVELV